jgi:hypothetical protein
MECGIRKSILVGTIYPDSRYITGIERELTHHNDLMRPEISPEMTSERGGKCIRRC